MLYHVLGSDISQHNQTLLQFFQEDILPNSTQKHHFYVVSKQELNYPQLLLTRFESKKAIALALITLAKREPQARFILHGQYNTWIWFALFCGKLPACRVAWHVWGADLYEVSSRWKFKLFYPLRRMIQRRLPAIWATKGDLEYVWKHIRAKRERDRLIYFPSKMPNLQWGYDRKSLEDGELTILLGNSGDRSNNHLAALSQLNQYLGHAIKLVIPMGYPANNESYIREVEQAAKRLFLSENVQILRSKIDFAEYLHILTACDLGYFNFERQQGIGTICLLIQQNIPVVLHPNNPFCCDLQAEQVPFLMIDNLSQASLCQTREALLQCDKTKIGFFYPNYVKGWLACLETML
ncbi:TDP-N-acetylfucosamine:lipid II N-acetylfucosaminyltransferase [Bibersteinia trehalosi]|uniref:TDP-N-acetylfucosamine:lipid II N-acetylfucosaminyltransferase n=1 Tax=Bibersteinia trehalosi TaxID=47735 RepID=UPI003D271A14